MTTPIYNSMPLKACAKVSTTTAQKSCAEQNKSIFSTKPPTKITTAPSNNPKNTSPKITVKEGLSCLWEGFCKKTNDFISTIINHPFKTMGAILLTSGAIMALPLIGIPSAVGGSTLLLAYGGISIAQTAINLTKFFKNNKNKNYDKARENLKDLGGNSIDLALSLPFLPKAFNTVKKFTQFGKIGINHSLISQLKAEKGLFAKFKCYFSANKNLMSNLNFQDVLNKSKLSPNQISEIKNLYNLDNDAFVHKTYEILTKNMKHKPKLSISTSIADDMIIAEFSPERCQIRFNYHSLPQFSKEQIFTSMVHELKHFEQQSTMLRYTQGLVPAKYQAMQNSPIKKLPQEVIDNPIYKDIIQTSQPIAPNSKEAHYAQKLLEARHNYAQEETNFAKYIKNFLEVDANKSTIPNKRISTIKDFFLTLNKEQQKYNNIHPIESYPQLYSLYWKKCVQTSAITNIITDKNSNQN